MRRANLALVVTLLAGSVSARTQVLTILDPDGKPVSGPMVVVEVGDSGSSFWAVPSATATGQTY